MEWNVAKQVPNLNTEQLCWVEREIWRHLHPCSIHKWILSQGKAVGNWQSNIIQRNTVEPLYNDRKWPL